MAETWTPDIPVVAHDVTDDVVLIEKNFDYLAHRFGYIADSSAADQAVESGTTIYNLAKNTIGTTKTAVIFIPHHMKDGNTTAYSFGSAGNSCDMSSYGNITFLIQSGAQISVVTGKTVTFPSPNNIQASKLHQIFVGVGSVAFGSAGGIVHPEWWGCVGDGSTDDTAAFLVCLTAAATKCRISIIGNYAIDQTAIPAGTYLQGNGDDGTITANDLNLGAIGGLLTADNKSDIIIRDLTIDCDSTSQSQNNVTATWFTRCTNIRVDNCDIICDKGGIYARESGTTLCSNVYITNNRIDNDQITIPATGIIAYGNDVKVTGNYILCKDVSAQTTNSHNGIVVGAVSGATASRILVAHNTIHKGYTHVAAYYTRSLVISGNNFFTAKTDSHSQGIYLHTAINFTISGNTYYDIDYIGIAMLDCSHGTVCGEAMYWPTVPTAALGTYGVAVMIDVGSSMAITVTGCSIDEPQNTNGDNGGIVFFHGSRHIATGNRIKVSGGNDLGINTNAATSCLVQDNIIQSGYQALRNGTGTGNLYQNNYLVCSGTNAVYDIAAVNSNRFIGNYLHSGVFLLTNFQIVRDNIPAIAHAETGNYTLVGSDMDEFLNNNGAGAGKEWELPAAQPGYRFHFSVFTAQTLDLDPNGTEVIRGGGAGKYLRLAATIGTFVTLECVAAGYWEIVASNGTLSYEA